MARVKVTGRIIGDKKKTPEGNLVLPFMVERAEGFGEEADKAVLEKLEGSEIRAYPSSDHPTHVKGEFNLLKAMREAGRDLEGLVLHGTLYDGKFLEVYTVHVLERQKGVSYF